MRTPQSFVGATDMQRHAQSACLRVLSLSAQ